MDIGYPDNLAHLPGNRAKWAELAVQCCLSGSSKTAPRIFFSIVLGAEYLSYVKSNAIYAPQKVDIIIHS